MKPNQILKSLLTGLGLALIGIPAVSVLYSLPLQWLLAALAGYGAGTLINRAGGRNGGPLAVVISVIATAIPFLVLLAPGILTSSLFSLLPAIMAVVAAALANRRS
jgi:hypothetical protein